MDSLGISQNMDFTQDHPETKNIELILPNLSPKYPPAKLAIPIPK